MNLSFFVGITNIKKYHQSFYFNLQFALDENFKTERGTPDNDCFIALEHLAEGRSLWTHGEIEVLA